jgi:hypothetical protein
MPRVGNVQIKPTLWRATKLNEFREDITRYVSSGRVTYDEDRAIKMSFAVKVSDPEVIDPYRDFLAPVLTLVYPDGEVITEQVGLYAVAPPKQSASTQLTRGDLDGRDLTWLLSVDTLTAPYTVTAGTNRIEAVRIVLNAMGLTRHVIADSPLTFDSDTTWPPDTSKLDLVNDILGGTGFYTLYMLRDGYLASMPWRDMESVQPAVSYATPALGKVRVIRTVEIDPDPGRIVNQVTVIRDDPAKDPLIAFGVNDNPASPVSTVTLGITIGRTIKDQNIASQSEADKLVARTLQEAASVYTRLKLTTTPDPSRNPHEVYELAISNAAGIVAEGVWWCTGWSVGFTPSDGPMTHDLNKLVPYRTVA